MRPQSPERLYSNHSQSGYASETFAGREPSPSKTRSSHTPPLRPFCPPKIGSLQDTSDPSSSPTRLPFCPLPLTPPDAPRYRSPSPTHSLPQPPHKPADTLIFLPARFHILWPLGFPQFPNTPPVPFRYYPDSRAPSAGHEFPAGVADRKDPHNPPPSILVLKFFLTQPLDQNFSPTPESIPPPPDPPLPLPPASRKPCPRFPPPHPTPPATFSPSLAPPNAGR